MAEDRKFDQITLNQIFTRNIRYLLDMLTAVANDESNSGAYYDYKIDEIQKLPYFDDIDNILVNNEYTSSGSTLDDLFKKLEEEFRKNFEELEEEFRKKLESLTTQMDSLLAMFDELDFRGTLTSLDSRVDALEADVRTINQYVFPKTEEEEDES